MKNLTTIINSLKLLEPRLKKKFQVAHFGIFGSYVRGEARAESDLDILVDFTPAARVSLLDFVALENFLSDSLGVKVDLVERSALKPYIGKYILQEVIKV